MLPSNQIGLQDIIYPKHAFAFFVIMRFHKISLQFSYYTQELREDVSLRISDTLIRAEHKNEELIGQVQSAQIDEN